MASSRFDQFLQWRATTEDPFVELDVSLAGLTDADLAQRAPAFAKALTAMQALEGGAIANADEKRQVGHYWLRAPAHAPDAAVGEEILANVQRIERFAIDVHAGRVRPPDGERFTKVVMVGIGGSALGPLLLADAFARPDAPATFFLFDNTDPDGMDRELARIGSLSDALILVASKSGGTPETRNGMAELQDACKRSGVMFPARAVALTMPGSALHRLAEEEGWLAAFPVWDWVGGRTSLFASVGLLPAALLGIDVRGLLAGAAAMDTATRRTELRTNPAVLLALLWHVQGGGRGDKAMVVLPYKDRLLLLSRYLQQLVMESLGKRLDRRGKVVHQGLSVYGNKGSTDQHAFVQQLRDGRADFFAVFVRVLRGRAGPSPIVGDGATSEDFLSGFWQGTRAALHEADRASATLTIAQLDERSFGAVIALFERAVGLYAELIDVNAYHQPGVEAGKKAAADVLHLQREVEAALDATPRSCVEIAQTIAADPYDVWPILQHLSANRDAIRRVGGDDPLESRFVRWK